MAKGKKTGAGDNAGAAQTGRFSDFSLDEARDVAQRNDPGPDVPSVSRVLLAEIARLEAELAQARAGNEQDPDAFTRNDHGAAALAWMRGTAVALGVGRADEGQLLLARALTHWIDLQRQGAQAQV